MTVTALRKEDKDGNRHYVHPVTGDLLTSVTTVLSATDNKAPYLVPWSARLVAEFAVDNLGMLLALVNEEGKDAAVDLVKKQAEQIRNRKADAGTYVHQVAEALILWAASPEGTGRDIALPTLPDHLVDADYDDEPLEKVVDWMLAGFTNFVAAFEPEFIAAEMSVYNRDLGVAGTLDMIIALHGYGLTPSGRLVASPGNRLVICADIKTGKLGVTAREQLAAYRRMTEALMPLGEVVPMPATDAGAVLHLRPEHEDGYRLIPVSAIDDARAWNLFRRDVEICLGRKAMSPKPGKVAYPLNPDGTMPAPRIKDLDGEGYGRALAPLTKAGLNDLDELAAFTATEVLALKGIGAKTLDIVRRMLTDYDRHLADEAPTAKAA